MILQPPPQSDKVRAFLKGIVAVCRKHNLVLTVSGYDALQVWSHDKRQADVDDGYIDEILRAKDRTVRL